MERSKRLNPNQEEEHLLKTITLVGRPNVGKSRLFNPLLEDEWQL